MIEARERGGIYSHDKSRPYLQATVEGGTGKTLADFIPCLGGDLRLMCQPHLPTPANLANILVLLLWVYIRCNRRHVRSRRKREVFCRPGVALGDSSRGNKTVWTADAIFWISRQPWTLRAVVSTSEQHLMNICRGFDPRSKMWLSESDWITPGNAENGAIVASKGRRCGRERGDTARKRPSTSRSHGSDHLTARKSRKLLISSSIANLFHFNMSLCPWQLAVSDKGWIMALSSARSGFFAMLSVVE